MKKKKNRTSALSQLIYIYIVVVVFPQAAFRASGDWRPSDGHPMQCRGPRRIALPMAAPAFATAEQTNKHTLTAVGFLFVCLEVLFSGKKRERSFF